MADLPQQPPALDPDCIPETVCDGPLNVQFSGNRATITFTHSRAMVAPLLERGEVAFENIVRARIVFSVDNLLALKGLLNRLLPDNPPADITAGSTRCTGLPY